VSIGRVFPRRKSTGYPLEGYLPVERAPGIQWKGIYQEKEHRVSIGRVFPWRKSTGSPLEGYFPGERSPAIHWKGISQEKEHRVSIGRVFFDRLTRLLLTILTYTEGAMPRDRIRQRLWRSFSDIIKVLSALNVVLRVRANRCVGHTDSSDTNGGANARHSGVCSSQITLLIDKQFH